ncbi:uncharacterized protein LOC131606841 [Vicia villosa]|uniref:uncharacterized protein LOC131606839 n=1 Tax=Vicia villosa TaxID=3911 RepID=UPI00273BA874|nr:uncharacterized protein LOC131606839 [Vicia villosa]XP_058734932.1 uncharacterized protein LOC131606841 [Vicia villosa]
MVFPHISTIRLFQALDLTARKCTPTVNLQDPTTPDSSASIMNLERSVRNLQAQNNHFQEMILNLSKGQEELKTLLIKKKKDQHRQQGSQKSKPKRSFTPLHMPLTQVLQQVLNQNLITLLPPYSVPANPAPGHKYNGRCANHLNSPGHDTEYCGPLKHRIQDLIDDKIIDFNSHEEPHMANVVHNQKGRNERNQTVGAVLISTSVPQQQRKPETPKRQLTKINMSLDQALRHLLKIELITPRDPPKTHMVITAPVPNHDKSD